VVLARNVIAGAFHYALKIPNTCSKLELKLKKIVLLEKSLAVNQKLD